MIHSAASASLPTLTFESPDGSRRRRRRYRVMISTIDLDPKPVHRIPTWVMRKEDYLQVSYFNTRIDRACRLCCLRYQIVKKVLLNVSSTCLLGLACGTLKTTLQDLFHKLIPQPVYHLMKGCMHFTCGIIATSYDLDITVQITD